MLRRKIKSDLISTIRGIRTRVLGRDEAQQQLREYQHTLILSGATKEARELGEAIAQLARGEEDQAGKTSAQWTFPLDRGKSEIPDASTPDEPVEEDDAE